MAEGICLKCGQSVDSGDINREVFPAIHRECGGEIAVHTSIGELLRELLDPPSQWAQPELGPPPGYLAKVLTGVNYDSEAEEYVRGDDDGE